MIMQLTTIPTPHPLTPPAQVLAEHVWLLAYEAARDRGRSRFDAIDDADEAVRHSELGK